MTSIAGPAINTWLLCTHGGDEVALALTSSVAADLETVSHLRRLQPGTVVAEILDVAISGRLQAQRSPARPSLGSQSASARTLVHDRLVEGLQQVATASGQPVGTYGAAAIAECLHGVSAAPLNPAGGQHFATDDAKVQIWLPDLVREALRDLADVLGMSDSDVVRSSLFVHLYGRLAYEQAVKAGAWRPSRRCDDLDFSEEPADGGGKPMAPRTALIEQIGKAGKQVTVFMPVALRLQLWATAESAGMRASEYLRRHLATYLLGRLAVDALPLRAGR